MKYKYTVQRSPGQKLCLDSKAFSLWLWLYFWNKLFHCIVYFICTLTGAQYLGSKSMHCLTGLCAAARPHTVGKIISTPRLCQGLSAFVIDGIPFSLFLRFHYRIVRAHMHTNARRHTLGVGPTASVRSSLWLHCVLMYLRILFCCSIV